MEYKLAEALGIEKQDYWNYRMELNMKEGPNGQFLVDKWLKQDKQTKENGESEGVSFWTWCSGKHTCYVNNIVLSFVQIAKNGAIDKWLFVSAAKVTKITNDSHVSVEIIEKYKPLFGRLIMQYHKGNKRERFVFKAETIMDNCLVYEILPNLYGSIKFPGYEHIVNLKMAELKNYIENDSLGEEWINKLRAVKAVYCLNDHKNHKVYIGSAYNDDNGLWGRWEDYLSISHGNNKDLKKLYNEKGDEYFLDNFYFNILETFPLNYKDEDIIKREHEWMNIFNSRDDKQGYNN